MTVSPLALRVLGLNVPLTVGPVPVGLILQASRYVSNRTVNLEVTGTVSSPSVQLKPLNFLTQEAVQFFFDKNNIPVP